ncbi:MAG: hypothetical protein WA432_04210 [Candidatus Babeliaceae bacterium]
MNKHYFLLLCVFSYGILKSEESETEQLSNEPVMQISPSPKEEENTLIPEDKIANTAGHDDKEEQSVISDEKLDKTELDKTEIKAPLIPEAPLVEEKEPFSATTEQSEKAPNTEEKNEEEESASEELDEETPVEVVQPTAQEKKTKRERRIRFNFVNEDLTKIINLIAAKLHRNIILPQGALAITQKVTFKQPKKIPLSEAEKYLAIFLDLAGYSMHKQNNFYIIVKNEQITREPLPLYVNVIPEELPHTDERIRAVYYLANLKVPEATQGPLQADPLVILLRESLSTIASFVFDNKSNGIIITDKATNIASVMKIILELDNFGSKEIVQILPLYNSSARTVADLLNKQILAVGESKTILRSDIKSESGSYFSSNIRILPYDEANKLIIMGRETAVNRIIDFVREYMDAPQESGNSILHAYDLQYLDSQDFSAVLQKVVAPKGPGLGQSQKEGGGPTIFFEGIKIVPETYKAAEQAKTITTGVEVLAEGTITRGGNRLIIAARQRDWKRIKALIEELDKPQRQVIIEVLIADITVTDNQLIGGQTRNPSFIKLPNGVEFQSAQLVGPITNETSTMPPTTLVADLLRLILGSTNSVATYLTSPLTGSVGSSIVSFNDTNGSGIWSILQILQGITTMKILSHPYLVTLNNFRAQEVVSNIRRVRGDQSIGEGGISSARQDDVEAALKVAVTPRISSIDRLNLQITVNIEEFVVAADPTNANRNTRMVQTNANLTTGQVLVIGGLTRLVETESQTETPILGQIPIIGWFFRNTTKVVMQSNLAVFISPTIVEPKLRDGQDIYTKDKIKDAYGNMSSGIIFDNLRDPITHWFFTNKTDADVALMNNYLEETYFNTVPNEEESEDKQLQLSAAKPQSSDKEDMTKLKALLAQETAKDLTVPTTQPLDEVVAQASASTAPST